MTLTLFFGQDGRARMATVTFGPLSRAVECSKAPVTLQCAAAGKIFDSLKSKIPPKRVPGGVS